MFELSIGQTGHFFIILSFVSSLIAAYSYWKAAKAKSTEEGQQWRSFSRKAFIIHAAAVIGTIASLFYIIYGHRYEYHYAWSHSSNSLPAHYMISCFWEGQEGSFLLWIFWHVLLGGIFIKTKSSWEAPVMAIFSIVQAFLVSMILGVVFFGSMKVGSSPFMLLRDVIEAPIFAAQPNFVPEDGTGLNPLLQNYWMVIHPPTLFLGFALTLLPFAFCLAGLIKGQYTEWMKPALPWTLIGVAVLGIGIMMGAYWAYETLNFGGYWNWDPVENAVYIPWLIMVGAVHVMIAYKRSKSGLKAAMIMVISSFILILYSTFLTRSGILGESSVHSFTDLGLSGQLLLYLLFFTGISVFLLIKNWKSIPTTDKEAGMYNAEFWVFIGVTILCLAAFQVLVPTSMPVYNSIASWFGIESHLAPPADQVAFYTKFQMWFGIALAIVSAIAQVFWWKRVTKKSLAEDLAFPLIITFAITTALLIIGDFDDWRYILLLTAGVFSIVSNGLVLLQYFTKKIKLSGGAVAHIGIALMLIGIMLSSGYSKVVSLNSSGLLYSREFTDDMNKENLLLFRGEEQQMAGYSLSYKGPRMEAVDVPGYIDAALLLTTAAIDKRIAKADIVSHSGKVFYKRGDTLKVYNENTYYEIEYTKKDGKSFSLFPRIQNNPEMGFVPSPDISRLWNADLYTHITNIPDPDQEKEWSKPDTFTLSVGDTFFVNDYVAVLENVLRQDDVLGVQLGENDAAVKAKISLLAKDRLYYVEPSFVVKDNMVGKIPETIDDLGVRLVFENVNPAEGKFTFISNTTQKEWVILKALEKPWVNILWIGTLVMGLGVSIAFAQRLKEGKSGKSAEPVEAELVMSDER